MRCETPRHTQWLVVFMSTRQRPTRPTTGTLYTLFVCEPERTLPNEYTKGATRSTRSTRVRPRTLCSRRRSRYYRLRLYGHTGLASLSHALLASTEALPSFVLTPEQRAKLCGRLDGDMHHTVGLWLRARVLSITRVPPWHGVCEAQLECREEETTADVVSTTTATAADVLSISAADVVLIAAADAASIVNAAVVGVPVASSAMCARSRPDLGSISAVPLTRSAIRAVANDWAAELQRAVDA